MRVGIVIMILNSSAAFMSPQSGRPLVGPGRKIHTRMHTQNDHDSFTFDDFRHELQEMKKMIKEIEECQKNMKKLQDWQDTAELGLQLYALPLARQIILESSPFVILNYFHMSAYYRLHSQKLKTLIHILQEINFLREKKKLSQAENEFLECYVRFEARFGRGVADMEVLSAVKADERDTVVRAVEAEQREDFYHAELTNPKKISKYIEKFLVVNGLSDAQEQDLKYMLVKLVEEGIPE